MSSTGQQSKLNRYIDWLMIVRIMLVQVLVLVALAGAVVWYLNWSSDAAWQEFISTHKPPVSSPNGQPQSQSQAPVQAVKGKAGCRRKA
jgi:flagellar basal body-associated protein FliL